MPTQPSLQQARDLRARQAALAASAGSRVAALVAAGATWTVILEAFARFQLQAAVTAVQAFAQWTTASLPRSIPTLHAGVTAAGFELHEPLVAAADSVIPAPQAVSLPDPWWDPRADYMTDILQKFERIVANEVRDAAREAAQVELAAEPLWDNYVRVLQAPSCKRCVVLAGRIYRDLEGFERHPNCFPAGVVVSGPKSLAATRRWYEGELVILRTASGQELPATANHPILTDQGWVPASLIQVGDHVIRSLATEGALPLVVPDEQQAPSLIQDVWRSLGVVPLGVVPSAAEDFHGDGGYGEVDVVLSDRLLGDRLDSAAAQLSHEEEFAGRVAQAASFAASGPGQQLLLGMPNATHGVMRCPCLGNSLIRGHAAGANLSRRRHVADRHPLLLKASADDVSRNPVALAERILALASLVCRRDIRDGQLLDAPRWDAPAGPLSMQNRGSYARKGLDLGQRLAGQVEVDRVVDQRRIQWSGHVYNLTSAEGWFSANGLIVSNCDCIHVPVKDWDEAVAKGFAMSPKDAIDKGYARDLTKGERQAIDDGANISSVINSSSGISTVTAFGRRVKVTSVGTTRRSAWRKLNPSLPVRLRPDAIYKIAAGDHDEALRLLKLYGYLA